MVKNLLIKCAELLNRSDIIQEIKIHNSIEEIEEQAVQNDVLRLISFYNYITASVFDNYLELVETENIVTDSIGNLYLSKLSKTPTKIVKLKHHNTAIRYIIYPNCLSTNFTNEEITITYNYLPKEVKDFNDKLFTKDIGILNTLSYGVASEFLASKNLFSESDFWKNRFMFNLFDLRQNKNRYIKPSFVL